MSRETGKDHPAWKLTSLAASWKLRALQMENCGANLAGQFLRECAGEVEAIINGAEANRTSWFEHERAAIGFDDDPVLQPCPHCDQPIEVGADRRARKSKFLAAVAKERG